MSLKLQRIYFRNFMYDITEKSIYNFYFIYLFKYYEWITKFFAISVVQKRLLKKNDRHVIQIHSLICVSLYF